MHNKTNILFLVHGFSMGGVQKVNVRMINSIDKKKFNVHVLYVENGMLMEDLTDDITISKLGSVLNYKSPVNIKYIIKTMKYIKENNIKIIHTIDPVLYFVGATAAHFSKIKHVRTQPNFIRRHERFNTRTMKFTPFESWTNKYITYNYASAKDLQHAGVEREKIETIYGFNSHDEFLNYEPISNIKEEFTISDNNKIILAMHRMVPNKGYETFIDMIPYIIKEFKNVTFLLVGDGPLRKQYEDRVENLGISEYVRFTGFQKNIANIVKQIDFGVYPLADTAAMGTVIRAGKVLITKRDSSMDEYIFHGETGYLVPEDKPEIYAEYALKLLKDPQLLAEMENNQFKFIYDKFDGEKNIIKLEEMFLNLCLMSSEQIGDKKNE